MVFMIISVTDGSTLGKFDSVIGCRHRAFRPDDPDNLTITADMHSIGQEKREKNRLALRERLLGPDQHAAVADILGPKSQRSLFEPPLDCKSKHGTVRFSGSHIEKLLHLDMKEVGIDRLGENGVRPALCVRFR